MPLSRLLYTSQSTLEGDHVQRIAAVRALAYSSSLKNGKSGLTGSLIFVENSFIQVLEGRSDIIESVFERICCDFRHRDVRLIDLNPIKERMFSNWSMALLTDDDCDDRFPVQEELARIYAMVNVNAPAAVNEMRALLRAHELA